MIKFVPSSYFYFNTSVTQGLVPVGKEAGEVLDKGGEGGLEVVGGADAGDRTKGRLNLILRGPRLTFKCCCCCLQQRIRSCYLFNFQIFSLFVIT